MARGLFWLSRLCTGAQARVSQTVCCDRPTRRAHRKEETHLRASQGHTVQRTSHRSPQPQRRSQHSTPCHRHCCIIAITAGSSPEGDHLGKECLCTDHTHKPRSFIHSFNSLTSATNRAGAGSSTKGGTPRLFQAAATTWCKLHPLFCGAARRFPASPSSSDQRLSATKPNNNKLPQTYNSGDVQGACTSETL